ncbi:peptidase domain-containing ABC transporter [Sediminibacterium roseum]|uniref:Peptidase domain-containing ABC transporter n=1 Tax=Sediminibacterium roseum TaxID=1978412 RepID=A0ABW9ZU34_9BACT|nr:peptidase domain-containing ABC transporter [Sediminibacterium roseum]NCI49558.1 peptidase domain-containing ABC transporter [Sediminibacterium roseum]
MKFPFYKQLDSVDCGPTCLKILARFHGKNYALDYLRGLCFINKEGVSLLSLAQAAEHIGYTTLKLKITFDRLVSDAPLPSILLWDTNHYVVLYEVKKNKSGEITHLRVSDPKRGLVKLSKKDFLHHWIAPDSKDMGVALLVEPSENFDTLLDEKGLEIKRPSDLKFILNYILRYRRYFFQLLLGIITSSMIALIFPFLTQNIVDIGINKKDIGFISLILIAQLVLFLSSTTLDLLRRQLQIHISARINISIISDFLAKLMRLPIRFFDSKNIGDIINRINDQKRIETFITSSVLNTVLLFFNFAVLTALLFYYNKTILLVFLGGTACTFVWVYFFMQKRKEMDYRIFRTSSSTTEKMYEMVNSMQEIKLNNFEAYKKTEWQKNQVELFEISLASTKLEQYQTIGSVFFTQLKNILVTYISAKAVINGDISLGMMLSITMIIGQMNNPVEEFISFFKSYQFARISLDRMNEVYVKPDEEENALYHAIPSPNDPGYQEFISFRNVNFQYEGPQSPLVLNDLSVDIPIGKTTAIVGSSGSGKTTLLKLLLKFYEPRSGSITICGTDLKDISAYWWRGQCGIVMQEGFVFSDTIERNIITNQETAEPERLMQAAKVACIDDYITGTPFGYQTKIGASGSGLSTGQKQRILIARAVYKDPKFFFFDEATSSLDTNNERMIVNNLNSLLAGKTAVVIAHRLSTVKNAAKILVLDNGRIVESGSHNELIKLKGFYFNLIKDQLELGS